MKLLLATIIITISIITIGQANDPSVAELNKIYILYGTKDFSTAEQTLMSLAATPDVKLNFIYTLELGDLYFDKLRDYSKAESIYKLIAGKYPKDKKIADIYYRLGLTFEKEEKFLDAAQMYEMVATKYRKSQYSADALDAIERCFRKNYQDLVSKVDGYPITRIEFDDRVSQAPANYDTYEKKLQLVNDMINERLMLIEALTRGLDKTPDFVSRFNDVRTNILFQTWYQKEVINKIKITESDKKNYYLKHKTEFITPEQVQAREILVKTQLEAESLYYKIVTYSLRFDSVAQETSLAPTKSTGGDLGWFRKGTQPEEIEAVAFKLKPKMVSTPFYSLTKQGYMLLEVEDKKPKVIRTYKEASAEIENRLRGEGIDQTFKTKTEAFKQSSNVTIDETAITENRDTAAIVDGQPILISHINDYIARIPPFYRSEFESPEGKKRILDQIILEKTWLKQLEKEKYWLLNSVFSQLEDSRRNLLLGNIRKFEVTDKIVISDNELEQEYKKNINDYKVPKQIRSREITVPTESLAIEVRKLALVGTIPFDSLARQYSTASTKWSGGDMGYFSLGTKPKQIEDVAFKLNAGQISNIIKLNDSTFSIIKLEEIKKPYTKSLDEVKANIQRTLRQTKDQELNNSFIANLRQPHQIEILLVDETPKQEIPAPETQTPETEQQE